MRSTCFSSTLNGIEARLVRVEVAISNGLPGLTVVGLPDAAVNEAGARVRAALTAGGFVLPPRRMVVNLSPADLRKQGSGFDLALALGLLEALEHLPQGCLQDKLVVGELSLDGTLRPVQGLVPALALAAERTDIASVVTCASPGDQMAWGVPCHLAGSLPELVERLREGIPPEVPEPPARAEPLSPGPDMSGVFGQPLGRWALELSAAGGHHLMMSGPPGCGKSLLAACLPGLLPPLTGQESLEVAKVNSVCGVDKAVLCRPFRAPGPGASAVALLGGLAPGEVTRAHHGVLFLDEFPEFRRDVLESLRQVLETGEVQVARARFRTCYPARFTLVAAMNPCPCGFYAVNSQDCTCSAAARQRYGAKLSGPLKDRFDLLVTLERQCLERYMAEGVPAPEGTDAIRQRIVAARAAQQERGRLNRELRGSQLKSALKWSGSDRDFAAQAAERMKLSVRSYEKWLRVARTVADLSQEPAVGREHLMQALTLRS